LAKPLPATPLSAQPLPATPLPATPPFARRRLSRDAAFLATRNL
jgi:hypothetical protein